MEPESSLLWSQEFAYLPYPITYESSKNPHIYLEIYLLGCNAIILVKVNQHFG
jgi:hypothetical protein